MKLRSSLMLFMAITLFVHGQECLAKDIRAAYEAVRTDDVKRLKQLLESGISADAHERNYYRYPLLGEAINNRRVSIVKLLLKHGADVNQKIDPSYSLLALAVSKNDSDMVKLLLKHGANVWGYPEQKIGALNREYAPLAIAVMNNNIELAQLLLDRGANPNLPIGNHSPIWHVAQYGHLEMAKLLKKYGANTHFFTNEGHNLAEIAWLRGAAPLAMFFANVSTKKELLEYFESANLTRAMLSEKGFDYKNGHDLVRASREGKKDIVTLYLQAGWSPDYPIEAAAHAGHHDIIDFLIAKGAGKQKHTNERGSYNSLSIALAAVANRGDIKLATKLIDHGADVNAPLWVTALSWSAQSGHVEMAKLLLKHGAKTELQNKDGRTAIWLAVNSGRKDIVELLLAHGASLEGRIVDRGLFPDYTLLMVAAYHGRTDIAKILIEKGLDVNASTESTGDTPLIIASRQGKLDTAKLLLEKGAKVNVKNTDGYSPIYYAVMSRTPELISMLKASGAETDTNIELAGAVGSSDIENARKLLASKVDPNFVFKDAQSRESAPLLLIAVSRNDLEMVRVLIRAGATPNQSDEAGMTPLMLAAKLNNISLVELLLKSGAKPDVKFDARQEAYISPPLHFAAANGNQEIVKLLLKNGADINAQSYVAVERGYGGTALMMAVGKKDISLIKLLISKGANPNITSYTGAGPLTMAKNIQNKEIIDILVKAGAKDRFKGHW